MIRWSWLRCSNLLITILGVSAIAIFLFVLADALLNA